MTSGIYQITCEPSGHRYIGSSKNIQLRWGLHLDDLKYGTHHSVALTRAYAKHGHASLTFKVILECRPEDREMYEIAAISSLRPEYNSRNMPPIHEWQLEQRRSIAAKVRKAWTPEMRLAASNRRKARPPPKADLKSATHRQKLREVHRQRHAKHLAFGRLWSMRELAEHHNVNYGMLKDRIRAGWNPETAVLTPKRSGGL